MEVRAPIHQSRSFRQVYEATPEKVFPMLCPVREAEWVPGWDPRLVLSTSGIAERGCVFVRAEDDGREGIWVVTAYDPEEWRISFVKLMPDHLVSHIEISLQDSPIGGCFAYVTYAHTALSESGEAAVAAFTQEAFEAFMREWQSALAIHLKTGKVISD